MRKKMLEGFTEKFHESTSFKDKFGVVFILKFLGLLFTKKKFVHLKQ
jgi:hypothetical protein